MLKEIGTEDGVDSYIEDKLSRKEKIMGMGHLRLPRSGPPRAASAPHGHPPFLQNRGTKWIRMSERIAKLVRERKGLNANVDFYSAIGLLQHRHSHPGCLRPFSPSPAVPGWVAQVLEQMEDNTLYRPLTLYTGPKDRIPVPTIDMR